MENRRTTIGILNAYDCRNRGDRAIVEAQIAWARRTWADAEVLVFSPHHKHNATVFGDSMSKAPLFHSPPDADGITRLFQPFLEFLGHKSGLRRDDAALSFSSCDAFLVCGGGYLYSSPAPILSRQLWLHALNILAALGTGKMVVPFPQSWGPIRKRADGWICRRLAMALPKVITRGRQSDELVASWRLGDKTIRLPDVVVGMGLLKPSLARFTRTTSKSLGIAPIDWGFDRSVSEQALEHYVDGLCQVSRKWCSLNGRTITVFPQVVVDGDDDDRLIAGHLVAELERRGIPSRLIGDVSWDDYWSLIGEQAAFLGSRMHSCIFALVCGVPTLGLAYQPKFAELFEQLGMPGRVYEIDGFDPGNVADQLASISSDPDSRSRTRELILGHGRRVVEELDQICRQLSVETPLS